MRISKIILTVFLTLYVNSIFAVSCIKSTDWDNIENSKYLISLPGVLTKSVSWGLPNFGDDPQHDTKFVTWILNLDKSIFLCASGPREMMISMSKIQVWPEKSMKLATLVDQRVSFIGKIYQAVSPYHITPYVFYISKINSIKMK